MQSRTPSSASTASSHSPTPPPLPPPPWINLVSGTTAGAVSMAAVHPIDLIKTRLQGVFSVSSLDSCHNINQMYVVARA